MKRSFFEDSCNRKNYCPNIIYKIDSVSLAQAKTFLLFSFVSEKQNLLSRQQMSRMCANESCTETVYARMFIRFGESDNITALSYIVSLNAPRKIYLDRPTDRQTDRQTYQQTDRQTHRQTDRQTDRQSHRQTDRQTSRQTNRQTDRQTER